MNDNIKQAIQQNVIFTGRFPRTISRGNVVRTLCDIIYKRHPEIRDRTQVVVLERGGGLPAFLEDRPFSAFTCGFPPTCEATITAIHDPSDDVLYILAKDVVRDVQRLMAEDGER